MMQRRPVVPTLVFAMIITGCLALPAFGEDWPMFGQNSANTAGTHTANASLSPQQISGLTLKWKFTTGGDVSARAAVVDKVVFFPDWAGNLYALSAANGNLIWSHQLSDYGLAAGTVARTSPAIAGGLLYIGTQYVAPPAGSTVQPPTGWLLAINARTGALVWKVQPDTSNPFPVITSSLTVAGNVVYVGMTSNEEYASRNPSYVCCSTRGSVVAVNALTGAVLWQQFTVPAGYTGGGVWGGNPVVDTNRGTVFVGTGNNYSIPTDLAYLSCVAAGGTDAACLSPEDHADSIVALDMTTGAVKWATRLMGWNQSGVLNGQDFWNYACVVNPYTECPVPTGPDYDFGSAPNEVTYGGSSGSQTIIGAGQKSGIYYALDPDTGEELWHTQVGPGSTLGGLMWGSASDAHRIYVAVSNYHGEAYAAGNAGSWAALNPATGAILWQVADPNLACDMAPVTVVDGAVLVASMADGASAPTMFALNAATGAIAWSFAAGSSVIAGASVSGGMVFWGSGYAHLAIAGFTGNNQFYAFGK